MQKESSTGACVVGDKLVLYPLCFPQEQQKLGVTSYLADLEENLPLVFMSLKSDYNSIQITTSTHARYSMSHSYSSQILHGSMSPIKQIFGL